MKEKLFDFISNGARASTHSKHESKETKTLNT